MNNIIKGDQRSQMKNKHRHFETNKSDVYYIETGKTNNLEFRRISDNTIQIIIKEIDEMTKREWLENEVGSYVLGSIDDDGIDFFYKNMKDDMSFEDTDRYAWLNTLFNYDIGNENALAIITLLWEHNLDVFEITKDDAGVLCDIVTKELGLHLDYSMWNDKAEYIVYTW